MRKRALVVGIGSPHGEDRLGWLAALGVKQRQFERCDVRIAMTPADLLDWLQGYETVHVCDACRGAGSRAAVHRWQWPDGRIEAQTWSGSHDLGLAGILELAVEIGMAPAAIILWGLEAPGCEPGAADHDDVVDQLIAEVVERISAELLAGVSPG